MADHHHAIDEDASHTGHHDHHDHHGHHDHLTGALYLTLGFAFVEAAAGWWSGSLALISDAGHMLTDSTALGLAALAAWLARKPPSGRHTYGLVRMEVLAALVNSLLMLALIVFIAKEALERFASPIAVQGGAVTAVAMVGLLVNLGVAWQLSKGEATLNTRAAMMHVLGDILGSVAALVAGLVITFTGWTTIDPLLSLLVSGLILVSAWRLLSEAIHVLLESVPEHIDLHAVGADLTGIEGVASVHDLHIWTLSSGQIALSAHLDIEYLADWTDILVQARDLMRLNHGIGHVTLQPEALNSVACPSCCPEPLN
ncbi:MAG: cation diffusion facilitator family transporter [Gallionellaceae bacterium]|nr:cation diffusion facilitator family transporter [Gallionellaceae bacterium]